MELHGGDGCFNLEGISWCGLEGCTDKDEGFALNFLQGSGHALGPVPPSWARIEDFRDDARQV